ncbi:MAG: hypothetical protein H6725_23105 [Sandaracinaceae bacterium]|nr:hypothetical protein [Sandaracinaceae bacterium]
MSEPPDQTESVDRGPSADDVGEHVTRATTLAVPGRARVRAFIVLAVAAQLLVPLTYYLRDDPYDERFAWRMFSGVRLQQCDAVATEVHAGAERRVALYGAVSPGWVANLERNRRAVIDRFLEHRCALEGVSAVRLTNRCRDVDGSALPPLEYERDCASEERP